MAQRDLKDPKEMTVVRETWVQWATQDQTDQRIRNQATKDQMVIQDHKDLKDPKDQVVKMAPTVHLVLKVT
jgi:hypothetical protein